MQWLELHPEFGMEVAKYRAGLSGAKGENKDVSTANLVPWKPDPMIVEEWKRWAQEQEDFKRAEEQEDIERALKSETDGAPDPTKQHDDSQGQAGRRPANRPGRAARCRAHFVVPPVACDPGSPLSCGCSRPTPGNLTSVPKDGLP